MDWCHKIISDALAAGLLFAAVIVPVGTMAKCVDCHNDIWQDAQKKHYIHRPVANKQCTSCHTGDMTDVMPASVVGDSQEQPITAVIADFNQQQQITWLTETFTPAKRHFALLDQQHANSTITIETWSPNRNKVQFAIPVPALTTMTTVQPFPQPTVTHLHRIDDNDMLLSHAAVCWETSNPSRCRVTYNNADGHEYSMEEDDLFTTDHTIVLHNCSKQDLLHVTCEDPFGQQLTTEPQKLESLPHQTHPGHTVREQSLSEQMIHLDFKKLRQDIWLELSAPLKFSVSIGTAGKQDSVPGNIQQPAIDLNTPVPEPPGTSTRGAPPQTATSEHEHLLPARAINLTICYRCHQNMLGWTSHPVDVIAPPGMIIPAEYPLLSGGLMSCMTCHTVHSSNMEYRLIKDSKRELCIGCHVNY